ncbi:MAG: DUF4012 domain-containing protein [Candidatus Magasanikbacteria bacterium]|nr:DUF4012 domain-containing protein [Candidatus Magasanikbacteria bacterium]
MTAQKKVITFVIALAALIGLVDLVKFLVTTPSIKSAALSRAVRVFAPAPASVAAPLFETILGYSKPRAYLVLFLNNTELRPSGGFIGAYAVVKVDQGIPTILTIAGTEVIDNQAKDKYFPPPAPLKKYLLVDRWQLRDSNWSPDFAESASTSLALFRLEGGLAGNEIDAVVGFTPTVLEKVLAITGPLTVDGQEFTAANATEKLEYEVEYGYAKRGQTFSDRKQILDDLVRALVRRVVPGIVLHWPEYSALATGLLNEKHIVAYSTDVAEEANLVAEGWGGIMRGSPVDYVLWADANMGALKTDVAIDRSLSYTFAPVATGIRATASMAYANRGAFTWRTSRYRDYARLFVPLGSKLVSAGGAMEADRSLKPGVVDQGIENGKQWFGAFISIEPGKTGTLSFTYDLPATVVAAVRAGRYELLAQKQIGTLGTRLTLHLDFGKPVQGATPGEGSTKHGDTLYDFVTDLKTDREFSVSL